MKKTKLELAAEELKKGKFVIILDSPTREKEADLVIHASFATKEVIKKLRKEAGGLICLVTDKKNATELGLEYLHKKLKNLKGVYEKLAIEKTPYKDSPAFSIYINSRECYTGITDEDRAKTAKEFEKILSLKPKIKQKEFTKRFYSPGHLPILIAKDLKQRKGHSEFSIALAKLAGLSPAMLICEMLSDSGKAKSFKEVKRYAKKNGIMLVEEKDF
ncbi:MAG: 3,4-dihydroxy-2-butanone-4-phosphate synthase [Candidatus Micrarchaeota archaeon]|nr:3,4-dihydroxy-2-butanone-4-phosphate synthase [Candidatus Micrarchaeota archaeon]